MKQNQTESESVNGEQPVQKVGIVRGRFSRFLPPRHRKLALIVIAGAACIIVAVLAWVAFTLFVKPDEPKRDIPTETQFLKNHVGDLLANQPAATAPSQVKAEYYTDLALTYGEQKDYQKAIEAFKQREGFTDQPVAYHHYITMATYYKEAGDTQGALTMLDKALRAMPAQDDDATGFYKEETLVIIQKLKQDYTQ